MEDLSSGYRMSANPAPMMSWDDYEKKFMAEWHALLNSTEGCDEGRIHDFLVRHPCWVPGAHSISTPSGHAPEYSALLSESPLREWDRPNDAYRDAVGMKVPDFMWFAQG